MIISAAISIAIFTANIITTPTRAATAAGRGDAKIPRPCSLGRRWWRGRTHARFTWISLVVTAVASEGITATSCAVFLFFIRRIYHRLCCSSDAALLKKREKIKWIKERLKPHAEKSFPLACKSRDNGGNIVIFVGISSAIKINVINIRVIITIHSLVWLWKQFHDVDNN